MNFYDMYTYILDHAIKFIIYRLLNIQYRDISETFKDCFRDRYGDELIIELCAKHLMLCF